MELFVGNTVAVKPSSRKGRRRQHLAALIASLASVCAGAAVGWSAHAVPALKGEDSSAAARAPLSEEEASWVSALVTVGAVVGALPAAVLANAIGRKTALLALAAPYALGWIGIAFAREALWLVYLGRVLTGLGTGATCVLVPIYCEEIAEVAIRGALGTYLEFMMCLGVLLVYVMGAFVPYFWYTLSQCAVPLLFLVTFVWMPESPYYLALKGRDGQAKKSLEWFRGGQKEDVQEELAIITLSLNTDATLKPKMSPLMVCSTNPIKSYTARAFAIVMGVMLFQQLSGINAVMFYTVDIFNEAGSNLSGEMCTIIVGVVQVIAVLCSSVTVDRVGRRFLLLLSALVMAVCLLSLSLYNFFTKETENSNSSSLSWIPLVSVILFVVVFALGFGPLPWLIMAEILPDNAKSWSSAIAVSFNWLIASFVTKEFPILLNHIGQGMTYLILCLFCVLGAGFVAKFIPETKGKTKAEIEDSIGGHK